MRESMWCEHNGKGKKACPTCMQKYRRAFRKRRIKEVSRIVNERKP